MKKLVVASILLLSIGSQAAFEKNWSRYPSPHVLIQRFNEHFPLILPYLMKAGKQENGVSVLDPSLGGCLVIANHNLPQLGFDNPLLGGPVQNSPQGPYATWVVGCLSKLISYSRAFMMGDYEQKGTLPPVASYSKMWIRILNVPWQRWSDYPVDVRKLALRNLFEDLFGDLEAISETNPGWSSETLLNKWVSELNQFEAGVHPLNRMIAVNGQPIRIDFYFAAIALFYLEDIYKY